MFFVAAVAVAVTTALSASSAAASQHQVSVFEDDHLLLNSGDAVRGRTLDTLAALGVDTIHTVVVWDRYAPQPQEGVRPAFDATDPASYGNWAPLDDLVASAEARGMHVLLSPSGRAPAWASECKGSIAYRQRCSPRVSDYADFVRALATRYRTVTDWSFWNEPNHSSWLVPQTATRAGIRVNVAAVRYRQMVAAGVAALHAAGHTGDTVLMGETAPLGSGHSTAPVDFYRELFCLDRTYRPFGGAAARARSCSPRPKLAISGVSHHPYTFGGVARPGVTGKPGDAPIGALGRIVRVLDAAARYGIVAKRLPIYLTEFGYQSRPPDPFGVSLNEQARYINYADFTAYENPRVASVAQYTLRDDPATAGFNTGLEFANGKIKPALAAYLMPIWVVATHSGHGRIFGQVRSVRRPVTVEVQHRAGAKGRFTTVADVQTNASGYFLQRFPRISGQWRLKRSYHYSRVASAGR